MNIYQVQISVHYAEDGESFKTIEFTDRNDAIECVNYLFGKKFDEKDDWHNANPFSGLDEDEQTSVSIRKTEELIGEEYKVIGFELNDDYDCSRLEVHIERKQLDPSLISWEL